MEAILGALSVLLSLIVIGGVALLITLFLEGAGRRRP